MKRLTGAQVFAAPRNAHKAKERLERAMLMVVVAREQATKISEQRTAQLRRERPTWWQKRRLAERLKSLAG